MALRFCDGCYEVVTRVITVDAKALCRLCSRGYIPQTDIEYDDAKDAANIVKHGPSLADATMIDLLVAAVSVNVRGYTEPRFRAFQRIDGVGYCLAFTVRGAVVRPISFRRAHDKEMRRHGR